ncbi:MAG: hypothetical protein NTV22_17210 [bacterium]|nr:hypothetical protein [bacterium]
MKICTGMLIATAALALWGAHGVSGSTLQWNYALGSSSVVAAVVADGSGGAVVCYAIAVSNAAYVTYLDKHGAPVWHKTYANTIKVTSKQVTKKQVIITLTPPNGWETVREITLKTGADTQLMGEAGAAFSTDKDVVAANKDSKGFFVVRTQVGSAPVYIYRFSYK